MYASSNSLEDLSEDLQNGPLVSAPKWQKYLALVRTMSVKLGPVY